MEAEHEEGTCEGEEGRVEQLVASVVQLIAWKGADPAADERWAIVGETERLT